MECLKRSNRRLPSSELCTIEWVLACLEMGHIDNAGIARSLLKKLDKAQANLDRGKVDGTIGCHAIESSNRAIGRISRPLRESFSLSATSLIRKVWVPTQEARELHNLITQWPFAASA